MGARAIVSALPMWFMHESMVDKTMPGSGSAVVSMIYGAELSGLMWADATRPFK